MSSMTSLKIAVSNVNSTFTSIAESDPQDIIFDMDGTLADINHRRHFVERKPKDWNSFYEGMIGDTPIQPVVMMAQLLKSAGHRIIIATGRPRKLAVNKIPSLADMLLLKLTSSSYKDFETIKNSIMFWFDNPTVVVLTFNIDKISPPINEL